MQPEGTNLIGQEHSANGLIDLTVVLPTRNAAMDIAASLAAVAGVGEVVVADCGSTDGTAETARACGASVVQAARGRGAQIAAGVARANGVWLLLLHADTRLQAGWREDAARLMRGPTDRAGYFRLAFDSHAPQARRLERAVAWRCRVFGLPYGDQGLLVSRALLEAVGGVRPLPLMEDVDLARRIGRRRLVALDAVALTSGARYVRDGWWRRSARNLGCLTLYFLGLPAHWVARLYG